MIPWTDIAPGEHRISCPNCGRGERDRTLGVTIQDGAGVAHCYRCQHIESWRDGSNRKRPGKSIPRPMVAGRYEGLCDYGCRVWNESVAPRGTIGAEYLLARCCALPPEDGDLRFHPALKHPKGYVGPALVALVTDAITRKPMTLHRTWIRVDGKEAPIESPRMLLGGHRKQGGVIRLWPDECITYGLGIAVGIETALPLATVLRPAWSLIDAGNLGGFLQVECLISSV